MMTVIDATDVPVRKTITVNVSTERAFKVFTEGFDTWWPRSHHIGKGALEKAVVETRLDRLGNRPSALVDDGADIGGEHVAPDDRAGKILQEPVAVDVGGQALDDRAPARLVAQRDRA